MCIHMHWWDGDGVHGVKEQMDDGRKDGICEIRGWLCAMGGMKGMGWMDKIHGMGCMGSLIWGRAGVCDVDELK